MPFILEYLLKFSLSLGVLYVFYRFVLRPLTFYQWNRFYLASYTLLSLVIPFINVTSWMNETGMENNRLLHAIPVLGNSNIFFAEESDSWWALIVREKWKLVLLILAVGSLCMLLKIIYQYWSLQMIKRTAMLIETSSIKLYDVNSNISPFSFANSIFINTKLHTTEELQKIMQHEFVHVKQKHTADILIGEMLIIVNWFNPFSWLVRKAIRQNLEFIADDNVLQTGLDARQYQYLLLKVVGIPQYSITNNFNFSSLKKRIVMMNKIKTTKVHLVKFLFIVPLLGFLLVAFRQKTEMRRQPGTTKSFPLLFNSIIDDTVPKAPPPPPPLPARPAKIEVIAPVPPKEQKQLPKDVKSMTITINSPTNESNAVVKLKNGAKETYDLSKPEERASFERKYGKLLPPSPPTPPTPAIEPVSPVEPVKAVTRADLVKPATKIVPVAPGLEPVVILDGKPLAAGTDVNTIDPASIESITVLKGANAISQYGKEGLNGVIIISSKSTYAKAETKKSEDISIQASSIKLNKILDFPGLVILNGKESTREVLSKIDPANIKEVNILKGDSAISQYKEKGNNGVMIITVK